MNLSDKLVQIAENTTKIYSEGRIDGYDAGKAEGYEEGYEVGYNEGFNTSSGINVLNTMIDRSITEINIPNEVTTVGAYAFCGCNKVKKVNIHNNVTSLKGYAFNGIGGFQTINKVIIPDSVTEIELACFMYAGVKTFIISKNLKQVGSEVFAGCSKTIAYDFSRHEFVPELLDINGFNDLLNYNQAKIIVPSALYYEWREATNWQVYKDYIVRTQNKNEPIQSKFNIYVGADTLKEIIDFNLLGVKLSHGVGKSELLTDNGLKYIRIYGDGTSSESGARIKNMEGKTTGKYLVFAYRLPATNPEDSDMQVFATTHERDITGQGDMFYVSPDKDSQWHVGIIDIEEAIQSSKWVVNGTSTCQFNANNDGTYTISRLRLDWFNTIVSEDSYIDVAYVGICDTLENALSADPDYSGRLFTPYDIKNGLPDSTSINYDKEMSYVTITKATNANGEYGVYLYSVPSNKEAMMLDSNRYVGIMYRNAPGGYCEFHTNSSQLNLTDSRWYSRGADYYEDGSDWKYMVLELNKLGTVCRQLRFDFFNKLAANTEYSIDVAFIKFFESEQKARDYYTNIRDKYEV